MYMDSKIRELGKKFNKDHNFLMPYEPEMIDLTHVGHR